MHFATLLVAAAVGVSAHPSGHNHRAFHAKKEAGTPSGKLITATINGKVVTWTEGAASPWKQDIKPEVKNVIAVATQSAKVEPAAATPTKEPTKDKDTSSSSSGKGATSYEPFCANSKREYEDYSQTSKANIAYKGNTGRCGYGSNFKLVASESAIKNYKYGIKVSGGSKKLVCGAFNKISANGGIDGFWVKNHAVKFSVPAGGAQWIAVDSNTQGGVMCSDQDKIPERPSDGYPTVTWAEIDFDSQPNEGHSGWDASGLPASKSGTACNALKFCAITLPDGVSIKDDKKCSSINQGMACDGHNAYTTGTEWVGGLGTALAPFSKGSFFLHADYS